MNGFVLARYIALGLSCVLCHRVLFVGDIIQDASILLAIYRGADSSGQIRLAAISSVFTARVGVLFEFFYYLLLVL